jgi:DnaK suppressor protein
MASAKKLKPAKGKKSPSAKKAPPPAARKAAAAKSGGKGKAKVAPAAGKRTSRSAQKPTVKKKSSPAKAASASPKARAGTGAGKNKPAGKKPVVSKAIARKPKKAVPAPSKRPSVGKKPVGKTPAAKPAAAKKHSEPGLATDRLRVLKGMLLAKRNSILKEAKEEIAKYMSGDNRQLVDTAIDEGDWAVVDISEDLSLRRLDSHRQLLLDIDESLRKIQEGTYGICEECGEEISEKRLNVIPTATLCIDCKENREKMEALALTPEL